MMWGCFCWNGVGYACKIDGRMDAQLYCSILDDDLQKSIELYGLERDNIIFQQDNDPKCQDLIWIMMMMISIVDWFAF